jgi:hypothetical protein
MTPCIPADSGRCIYCQSETLSHDCPGFAVAKMGLGDYVAAGLSAIGVTKDRVEAVVGGPCGCDGRQAAMNAAGAKWLGLPPGSTAPAEIDPGTP